MIGKIISYFLRVRFCESLLLKLLFLGKKINVKSVLVDYRAKILHGTTIMEGTVLDSSTIVGMNCYIGRYCYITKSVIGNYCSIANNVSIGQGEHSLSRISTSSLFYENVYESLTEKDCIIGNDVWIGVDAIVLRGVTIGDGAVIGANSVVTKSIPPFAVAVGSPAKVVKFRFSEKQIEDIIKSEWWNHDIADAREIIGYLNG